MIACGFLATLILVLCASTSTNGYESCYRSEGGQVRLKGFNSTILGYVQVCKDGEWTPISFEDEKQWTRKNSVVACKQLGFLAAVGLLPQEGSALLDHPPHSPTRDSSSSLWTRQYYSVECTGMEERLVDCTWTINNVKSQRKNAMVLCREEPYVGELSIVGISGADNEGLLTMYNPLKTYQWSTLCSTQWDDSDAEVACREMGYQGGYSKTYTSEEEVRHSSLPRKRYSYFDCSGSEEALMECQHTGPYPYQCTSAHYAGVVCTAPQEDDPVLKLNIILLSFMILISVLLIIILSLLLRCTLNRFNKKRRTPQSRRSSTGGEEDLGRGRGNQRGVLRTRLDHDMPYALLSTIAPPSYEDTLLADQLVEEGEMSLTAAPNYHQPHFELLPEDPSGDGSNDDPMLPSSSTDNLIGSMTQTETSQN